MTELEPLIFPAGCGTTPLPGERVMVITGDLLSPGYIDFDGGWHREADGAPFKDVLGWSPVIDHLQTAPTGLRLAGLRLFFPCATVGDNQNVQPLSLHRVDAVRGGAPRA